MQVRARLTTWRLLAALLALFAASPVLAQQPDAPAAGACAKIWLGREAELEAYLKTAKIDRIDEIPLGVTRPLRAFLAPGGPFGSMAWKPLRPGIYDGAWESYKSEIAAYELDKLLELHMTPPTVERQIDGRYGAAIMWIAPVTMWRDMKREDRPTGNRWTFQIIRQRMFDDLIGNDDRNKGNLLIDGDGHLCLIDASRAFLTSRNLPLKIEKVDAMQWGRISALTEESLTAAVGTWLDQAQIRALLDRRARIKQEIDKLVVANGAAKVFVAEGKQ
jgi:hypothetical protein